MKSIFISGGTGFLAKALIPYLLEKYNPDSIRLFARNDYKMAMILREYGDLYKYDKLRPMIGDACDRSRVFSVIDGCDLVIILHALKRIEMCTYCPQEAIKVNVIGSMNCMDACLQLKIPKMVFISTDKAYNARNLYGKTKAVVESMITSRALMLGENSPTMNIVRYGNVFSSTGSCFNYWIDLAKQKKPLPLTDENMTRFLMTKRMAVELVGEAIDSKKQGEILLPKELYSVNMKKAADWINDYFNSGAGVVNIGQYPDEKLDEELGEGISSDKYLIDRNRFIELLKEDYDL